MVFVGTLKRRLTQPRLPTHEVEKWRVGAERAHAGGEEDDPELGRPEGGEVEVGRLVLGLVLVLDKFVKLVKLSTYVHWC